MESTRKRVLQPWLVVAALMMLFGFGFSATSAVAQDDNGPTVPASPDAGPADDSVSALPETGSGSDSTSAGVLVTALALATSVLGLGALAMRKMLARR